MYFVNGTTVLHEWSPPELQKVLRQTKAAATAAKDSGESIY